MIFLVEIKNRMFYWLFSFFCTFFIGYLTPIPLVYILSRPLLLLEVEHSLFDSVFIFTEIAEAFQITIWSVFLFSFYLSFPLLAYHLWLFIIPGCYYKERLYVNKIFRFFSFVLVSFFLFSYCCFLPLFWKFLLTFQIHAFPMSLILQAKMKTYIETINFIFFPVLFVFLFILIFFYLNREVFIFSVRYNIISHNRRSFLFFCLLLSSIFSPPDIVHQLIFAFVFLFYCGKFYSIFFV
jgi:sec-independent protein translocase protein TatC